jgi:hypothetical protein
VARCGARPRRPVRCGLGARPWHPLGAASPPLASFPHPEPTSRRGAPAAMAWWHGVAPCARAPTSSAWPRCATVVPAARLMARHAAWRTAPYPCPSAAWRPYATWPQPGATSARTAAVPLRSVARARLGPGVCVARSRRVSAALRARARVVRVVLWRGSPCP